jgi:hypothetical protein
MGMWRIFYEQDVRVWKREAASILASLKIIYTGPLGAKINGYERLGRIIAGTAALLVTQSLAVSNTACPGRRLRWSHRNRTRGGYANPAWLALRYRNNNP